MMEVHGAPGDTRCGLQEFSRPRRDWKVTEPFDRVAVERLRG
jgi:hypothetical protein